MAGLSLAVTATGAVGGMDPLGGVGSICMDDAEFDLTEFGSDPPPTLTLTSGPISTANTGGVDMAEL